MKKFALLAALMAAMGIAQAQSNVALYGTLDAGVANIQKGNGVKDSVSVVDSAMATSIWGLRGTEDLGGGMKATFNVEGDINTSAGTANAAGNFRRAANVGLSGSFGEIAVGLKRNPLIAAHAGILPVAGNSVSVTVPSALGYADFFTKNAVTYTTPTMGIFTGQLQYGAANTVGSSGNDGTMTAGRLTAALGALTVDVAGQKRNPGGSTLSANGTSGEKNTWLIGANYKTGPLAIGAGLVRNESVGTGAVGNVRARLIGVGYDLTPAVTLGANYVKTNDDASLTNLQTRYAFSKRTSAYAQVGRAQNGNTSNPISPIWTASSVSGLAGTANSNQTATSFGIIHSF